MHLPAGGWHVSYSLYVFGASRIKRDAGREADVQRLFRALGHVVG